MVIDRALGRVIEEHADHLIPDDAQRCAVITRDPRRGPPESVPWPPFPLHCHLPTDADNAMGEFDPGQATRRADVQSLGDGGHTLRRPVGGFEDVRPGQIPPVRLMGPDGAEHEAPPSVRINDGSTERRSVQRRGRPPINAPVRCDERNRAAVAHDAIRGDWNVAVVAGRVPHALTSPDVRDEVDTLASARASGRRPIRGPIMITIASPRTRPTKGAPGLASPVVMRRVVAAAGA